MRGRHSGRTAAALAAWATAASCVYAPETLGVPDELDQAPYYFPEDVSPPAGSTVGVVLVPRSGSSTSTIDFGVQNLFDRTLADVVNVTWYIETDDFVQTAREQTELTAVTLDSGVGRFETPQLTLQTCVPPLDGSLSQFRVRLRIRDEIPPADRTLVGATSYELNLVWNVRVTGGC